MVTLIMVWMSGLSCGVACITIAWHHHPTEVPPREDIPFFVGHAFVFLALAIGISLVSK